MFVYVLRTNQSTRSHAVVTDNDSSKICGKSATHVSEGGSKIKEYFFIGSNVAVCNLFYLEKTIPAKTHWNIYGKCCFNGCFDVPALKHWHLPLP